LIEWRFSNNILRAMAMPKGESLRWTIPTLTFRVAIALLAYECAYTCVDKTTANSAPEYLSRSQLYRALPVQDASVKSAAATAFPLKASSNNRYLVDQENAPFLMVGDAPQTLITNLSLADAGKYMANRQRYGINTLWINLICNFSDGCTKDATTFDGIQPFTVIGDISTPNTAYFRRAAEMITLAASHGMVVLLDPIETSSWLPVLRANGLEKAFAYGRYLGDFYKDLPNIIWLHGNDFQSWRDATDDALVQAVARGIRSRDPNHIHSVELNYLTSGSLDDPTWSPLIELNAAYTYFPTYAQVLTEYNRPEFKPIVMVEANYEFEHNPDTDGGSTQNLRRQEYWTMMSGATGQVYGSAYTWRLGPGWDTKLDTPGVVELSHMKNLFSQRRWYELIPDQNHTVVTAGYDRIAGCVGRLTVYLDGIRLPRRLIAHLKRLTQLSTVTANSYAPAARTSDGWLVIAYLPSIRTVTVDMSKLAGPAIARWYDPANGDYIAANSSAYTNTGSEEFTPPGNNSAGDGDWVLILEVIP
jgi:uncharacterized protein DUF4038/collagenase-like protein with putative collagen-binding domain